MVTVISGQPIGPIFKDQQCNKVARNRWMCSYSFLFSSLPAWGLSIVSLVFFLCCHSFFPSFPVFFTLLSWPCFIFHFSIALCALMAPIPFLLHFFCTFPGSFVSPVSDLFIFLNVTSFLTLPLFFIMCLYSGSPLPLFIPFPSWWPLHAAATWLPLISQRPIHCLHHPLRVSTSALFQHFGLLDSWRWGPLGRLPADNRHQRRTNAPTVPKRKPEISRILYLCDIRATLFMRK